MHCLRFAHRYRRSSFLHVTLRLKVSDVDDFIRNFYPVLFRAAVVVHLEYICQLFHCHIVHKHKLGEYTL